METDFSIYRNVKDPEGKPPEHLAQVQLVKAKYSGKRAIVALLKSLGLMPLAHKIRMFSAVLSPKTFLVNLGFWFGSNRETLPIPALWSRLLVCGSADIPAFLDFGKRGFDCIRDTLERNGTPIGSLKAVLDFGCGPGRVIRHWTGFPDTRICGTDMNGYLVDVCQKCVPFAKITTNSLVPKLDYADQSFDLIYAFSVFTHLDVAAQKAWRDEFRRILRPGGQLILSVHGKVYTGMLDGKELADFNAGRPVVRLGQYPGANLCVSFHPEAFVRHTLAEGFAIVEFAPEGAKGNPPQDLYLLRRVG